MTSALAPDTRRGDLRRLTLLVFVSALALYGLTAILGGNFHHQELAYFNQLAAALLRGDLYLANPDGTHDLILYHSRWFVPFPPGPALLLLPFVALRGVAFNEVALSVAVGALNVALMFRLLQVLASRSYSRLEQPGWLWLTSLFAAGTVHWYVSATGTVSFLAHTLSVTGLTAALWLAADRRSPWLVGLAMGWTVLCRPTMALAAPALLALMLLPAPDGSKGQEVAGWPRKLAGFVLPQAAAAALLLAYNQARFGNWLEFGYGWAQTQTPFLQERLATWGQFSLHYVPENLRVALLGLPLLRSKPPFVWPQPVGLSVLLVTPTLLWLYQSVRRNWLVAALWLSIGLISVPLVLYYNTGWVQFGYRFSLDWLPLAFVLLAIGIKTITPLVRASVVAAWLVNLWGVVWWFARFY